MAKGFHITVAGTNDADMMILANYLEHNIDFASADVATSSAAVVNLIQIKKSSLLVIEEHPDLDLELTSVLEGLGEGRKQLKVVALVTGATRDRVLALEAIGVDRVVDRSQPEYYDAVQSIVQESEGLITVEEKVEKTGLTTNAWIGMAAVVAMILLALLLLLR